MQSMLGPSSARGNQLSRESPNKGQFMPYLHHTRPIIRQLRLLSSRIIVSSTLLSAAEHTSVQHTHMAAPSARSVASMPTIEEHIAISMDEPIRATCLDTELVAVDPAVVERILSSSEASTPASTYTGALPHAANGTLSSLGAVLGLERAAFLLRSGQVVAISTETVYGLAANALDASAVSKVFAAKNRPQDNPLIIHISSLEMLAQLYPCSADGTSPSPWQLPAAYAAAVSRYWPGPLTILLPRSPLIPDAVTAGQATMAVRMPSHPVARGLIELCGFPLAAPSANTSGRPSPTLASHVLEDLNGRIPLVVDGGACDSGVESTVLDALRSPPVILRPGGVTYEQLAGLHGMAGLQVYRKDFVDADLEAAPTTPGMKYRHYSPTAPVVLFDLTQSGSDSAASSTPQQEQQGSAGSMQEGSSGLQLDGSMELLAAARAALQGAVAAELSALQGLLQVQAAAAAAAGGHGALQAVTRVGVLLTSRQGMPSGFTAQQQQPHSTAIPYRAHVAHTNGLVVQALEPAVSQQHAASSGSSSSHGEAAIQFTPSLVVLEYVLGDLGQPPSIAKELFRALRAMDEAGVELVLVEGVWDEDEGLAVMNRLRKAASRVVQVQVCC